MDQTSGYNPDDFLLLQRTMEAAGNNTDFFTRLPPASLASYGVPADKRKYCLCCGISVYATDQPALNKGWANATWERKQEIIADTRASSWDRFTTSPTTPRYQPSCVLSFRILACAKTNSWTITIYHLNSTCASAIGWWEISFSHKTTWLAHKRRMIALLWAIGASMST